ncbi:hypothetical protein [Bradyrhizobium sp. LMG 9283]|uniref:hypothetical protein n=1 Tax=Bradyrhizobium sp. LMG 9283 TaxID=592064 RepID=UPI00388E916F
MNRISFYLGIALIIVGLATWYLRPSSQPGKFKISVGGLTIEVDVPAFFIVAVGVVLMYISTTFPDSIKPPGPPVPQIPEYDSGWVDGGKNRSTRDYCDPQWEIYKKQYPDFTIEKIELPEETRTIDKSITDLRVQQYKYRCKFVASRK